MVRIQPVPADRLIEAIGGTVLFGNAAGVNISHIGEPLEAEAGGVAFVISEFFVRDVPQTKAEVLVIQAALAEKILPMLPPSVRVCIACKDAYVGLANFSKLPVDADPHQDWQLVQDQATPVHPRAKVDSTAKIGPGAVVCEGAVIGPRTILLPNVVVGPEAEIGADCVFFPGVVIYPRTKIGNRVRLHANVVLGSDGFGYARGAAGSVKIWHLGRVIVEDDVEVGAGSTIDRGTLKDTVIEKGVKIDNLVQVGHNVRVKAHAVLCAQVGLAGNATVGVGAILAGKAGVADKIEVGDGAVIGPMTGASKDVPPGQVVIGHHTAKPRREWWKLVALFDRLPELYDRVKKLEGNQK